MTNNISTRYQNGPWKLVSKFRIKKPKFMHSCRIHKMHNHPALMVNGTEISITHQHKFPGIILDSEISFISHPHVKQLRIKWNQTLVLLRAIAHTDRVSDKKNWIKLSNMIKNWLWSFHIWNIGPDILLILIVTKIHDFEKQLVQLLTVYCKATAADKGNP